MYVRELCDPHHPHTTPTPPPLLFLLFWPFPKTWKMQPLKKLLLQTVLMNFKASQRIFHEPWVYFGSRLVHFSHDFWPCHLGFNFKSFWEQKSKKSKNEKVPPDTQNTMFREGRQLKNNACRSEKMRLISNRFFKKNWSKIDEKIEKTSICHKNR